MKTKRALTLSLMLLMSACGSLPSNPDPGPSEYTSTGPAETALPAGYGVRGTWFELYFTNPESELAPQRTGGVDGPLVEAIDAARLSVDAAFYSLSLNSIRGALLRAHDRGVRVRIVMESDNRERADPELLADAGIPVLGDRREGLMHNKFMVIDGAEVWMGSMNFTDSGAYQDNNGMLRIRSLQMAENFTREFEEMFVEDRFGEEIGAGTPNPRVTIDGVPLDVYFSPDDGVQGSLVDLLDNARESIHFLAFSFTADPLGEAIRNRAREGVTVSGVMDSDQVDSNIGTEFDPFSQAGVQVLRDGNPGQMHHKLILIDGSVVVFGSYNFTNSAETRNDESLVVIYDEAIAAHFMAEFERVHSRAMDPPGASLTMRLPLP